MIISISAGEKSMFLEAANTDSAYLYEDSDAPILFQEPTDSSQRQGKPGFVCSLLYLLTEETSWRNLRFTLPK